MTTPEAGPVERAAHWEDFVDIFYAPSRVFARRKDGKFVWQIVIVTVLAAALFFVAMPILQPMFDAEMSRGAERMITANPEVTPEQIERSRSMMMKLQPLALLIVVPITICLLALVSWAAGKIFDSQQTVRSAFVVATYAYVPRVVEQIVAIAQGFVLEPAQLDSRYAVSLSAARFLDPDTASGVTMAVAGSFDAFVIWQMVLIAIGISVTGGIPRSRAAMAAAIVWLLAMVPSVLIS